MKLSELPRASSTCKLELQGYSLVSVSLSLSLSLSISPSLEFYIDYDFVLISYVDVIEGPMSLAKCEMKVAKLN